MLKAADALAEAGYAVHVVATRHEPWAAAADIDVRSRRGWPLTIVNYCRGERGSCYWRTGVEHRASRALARAAGVGRVPPAIATRAFARVHGAPGRRSPRRRASRSRPPTRRGTAWRPR